MITAVNLTKNSTFTQATSYNTASISPTANKLILLTVVNNDVGGGTPNTPTVTGAGLTWVQVVTFTDGGSPPQRMTVFRALGGSPTTGALTVDFGGQTQNHFTHTIEQWDGMDITGANGANAIVQTNTKAQTGSSSPSVSLGAFSNLHNATYGVIFQNGTVTLTNGVNFTQLANTVAAYSLESEWANSPQTTVDWSMSNSNLSSMIAVEIKIAPDTGLLGSEI